MTPPALTAAQRSRRLLLASMSEAEWQGQVTAEADARSVRWVHIPDSRRRAGTPGYPDLHLWGAGGSAWAELKREGEYPTAAQRKVHEELRALGHEVAVFRPGDLLDVIDLLDRLAGV